MAIPENHRAYLIAMHAIGADEQGRETLVGLSVEQTTLYFQLMEARLSDTLLVGEARTQLSNRWIALDSMHQMARLHILAAEAEARLAGMKH